MVDATKPTREGITLASRVEDTSGVARVGVPASSSVARTGESAREDVNTSGCVGDAGLPANVGVESSGIRHSEGVAVASLVPDKRAVCGGGVGGEARLVAYKRILSGGYGIIVAGLRTDK